MVLLALLRGLSCDSQPAAQAMEQYCTLFGRTNTKRKSQHPIEKWQAWRMFGGPFSEHHDLAISFRMLKDLILSGQSYGPRE